MSNAVGYQTPSIYEEKGETDMMTKRNLKNRQKNFVSLLVVVLLALLMVMPAGVIKAWPMHGNFVNGAIEY